MPRALNMLRPSLHYRREAFDSGLRANDFELVQRLDKPSPGDVVLIWNRAGAGAEIASHVERHGGTVLVAENGWCGKLWRGHKWFTLTLGQCGGAGIWSDDCPSRWDSWCVPLAPWRKGGGEIVVFEQRGIGAPGLASPPMWAEKAARLVGGRIRKHPGAIAPAVSLEDDLQNAWCCVTWHSAAAMAALMMGVPVFHDSPTWIGAGAARPFCNWGEAPRYDDEARLAMFRRAAWCLWSEEEIRNGEAIGHLLAA